jgi:hypothetical protein
VYNRWGERGQKRRRHHGMTQQGRPFSLKRGHLQLPEVSTNFEGLAMNMVTVASGYSSMG